jgi:hypothetical protein
MERRGPLPRVVVVLRLAVHSGRTLCNFMQFDSVKVMYLADETWNTADYLR